MELRLCSFENALGCVGGACCSDWDLVEYQRLSGAGYCFSAAAPPFLSACASFNISYLSSNPALVERLAERTAQLTQAVGVLPARNGVELSSAPESPVTKEEDEVREEGEVREERRERRKKREM